MPTTLAFDVYGTLIDTHGVISVLEKFIGAQAFEFSRLWREKQLEYSFRRGLMQNYQSFAVCTRDALEYTCLVTKASLSNKEKLELMNVYSILPSFKDVKEGLEQVKKAGFRMFAFSNGSSEALELLLANANIRKYFIDIVSADEIKTFKPSPAIYRHFLKRANSAGAEAWLISSNPFDIIGAISSGMRAAWVQRSEESIFDPWDIKPTIVINKLSDIAESILNESNKT
jgi:2-haloacid dehalogenase